MSQKKHIKERSLHIQNKVLKTILNMELNSAGYIYRPHNFEDNFPFITSIENLQIVLSILDQKGIIEADFSYYDDNCFINTISITPQGYNYFPDKKYKDLCFWIPIVVSSTLSIIAIIISLLTIA
mgnify:CR=1 FL=1